MSYHRICQNDELMFDLLLEATQNGAFLMVNNDTQTTIITPNMMPGFRKVHACAKGIQEVYENNNKEIRHEPFSNAVVA